MCSPGGQRVALGELRPDRPTRDSPRFDSGVFIGRALGPGPSPAAAPAAAVAAVAAAAGTDAAGLTGPAD